MKTTQLISGLLSGATLMVTGSVGMAQAIDPAAEIRARAEPMPEKEAARKTVRHGSRLPTAAAYKAGFPGVMPAVATQHTVAVATPAGGADAIAYKVGHAAWATEKGIVPISSSQVGRHASYAPTKPWIAR